MKIILQVLVMVLFTTAISAQNDDGRRMATLRNLFKPKLSRILTSSYGGGPINVKSVPICEQEYVTEMNEHGITGGKQSKKKQVQNKTKKEGLQGTNLEITTEEIFAGGDLLNWLDSIALANPPQDKSEGIGSNLVIRVVFGIYTVPFFEMNPQISQDVVMQRLGRITAFIVVSKTITTVGAGGVKIVTEDTEPVGAYDLGELHP